MAEQWNPTPHKPYLGRVIDNTPVLLSEGKLLTPMKYIWQQRSGEPDANVRETFCSRRIFSADLRLLDSEGNLKILIYTPGANDKQYFDLLQRFEPNATLRRGALALGDDLYKMIKAPEIKRQDVERYATNKPQSEQEAVDNGIFRLFADDANLIRENHRISRKRRGVFHAMGIYLNVHDVNTMRLWVAGNVYDVSGYVDGNCNLGGNYGRVVGVAPEALAISMGWPKESLETTIKFLESFKEAA